MATFQSAPQDHPPARVSEHAFMGIIWSGLVITFATLLFRMYARIRGFNRLWWDDALVVLAWLLLLGNAVLWQFAKTGLYAVQAVSSGRQLPGADFVSQVEQYLRLSAGYFVLFYTSLWSVKVSFLIFFRRLGQNVNHQRVIWWSVSGVVVAGYAVAIGTIRWKCSLPPLQTILDTCSSPSSLHYENVAFRVNCAIDVLTDALVMVIPLNMLWRVQISLRQKIGLLGVFCLTIFIMIVSIVRVALVDSKDEQADQTWLYTWSNVEQIVALIVAGLASVRSLFTQKERTRRSKEEKGAFGEMSLLQRRTKPSAQVHGLDSTNVNISVYENDEDQRRSLASSQDTTLPPEGVHVRDYHDISHKEQPLGMV